MQLLGELELWAWVKLGCSRQRWGAMELNPTLKILGFVGLCLNGTKLIAYSTLREHFVEQPRVTSRETRSKQLLPNLHFFL